MQEAQPQDAAVPPNAPVAEPDPAPAPAPEPSAKADHWFAVTIVASAPTKRELKAKLATLPPNSAYSKVIRGSAFCPTVSSKVEF